jgi:hypothetical protein
VQAIEEAASLAWSEATRKAARDPNLNVPERVQ